MRGRIGAIRHWCATRNGRLWSKWKWPRRFVLHGWLTAAITDVFFLLRKIHVCVVMMGQCRNQVYLVETVADCGLADGDEGIDILLNTGVLLGSLLSRHNRHHFII